MVHVHVYIEDPVEFPPPDPVHAEDGVVDVAEALGRVPPSVVPPAAPLG